MGEKQDRQVACLGCGHVLASTAKFCGKCGATQAAMPMVDTGPALRNCPKCGHACRAGAPFCGKCGHGIDGPAPVASSLAASDRAAADLALAKLGDNSLAPADALSAPQQTPQQAPPAPPAAEHVLLKGDAIPVSAVPPATHPRPDAPAVVTRPPAPAVEQGAQGRPVGASSASGAAATPRRVEVAAGARRQRTPWIVGGALTLVLLVTAAWLFSGHQRPAAPDDLPTSAPLQPVPPAAPVAQTTPEPPPAVSAPVLPPPAPELAASPAVPSPTPASVAAPEPAPRATPVPAPAQVAVPAPKPAATPDLAQQQQRRERAEATAREVAAREAAAQRERDQAALKKATKTLDDLLK